MALHGTKSSPLFPAHHYWRQTAWEAVDRRTRERERWAEIEGWERWDLALFWSLQRSLTWYKRRVGITWHVFCGSLWIFRRLYGNTALLNHNTLARKMLNTHFLDTGHKSVLFYGIPLPYLIVKCSCSLVGIHGFDSKGTHINVDFECAVSRFG